MHTLQHALRIAAGFVVITGVATSACHGELSARESNSGESGSGGSAASSGSEARGGHGGSSMPSGGSASKGGQAEGSQGGDSSSSASGGSSSGSGGGSSASGDSTTAPAADPCIEAGTCPPGTWIDVTPSSANVTTDVGDCGTNYGTKTVQADPAHPGSIYTHFVCQGLWKSTDYGFNWQAPPTLQIAAQPGTGMWSAPMTPAEMTQGPAQAAVMNDGKRSIIVLASYNAGLWRYVEP